MRFLDCLLSEADVETIGRTYWWDRAKTALETASTTGTAFSEVVATACRKLQITWALSAKGATEIAAIGEALSDPGVFADWRELMASDAIYITALTRVHRQSRKATA